MTKSDRVRLHHEKERWGERGYHTKWNDGVRVHYEKER